MFNVLPGVPDNAIEISGSKSTNKGCLQQEDGDTLTMTTNITTTFGSWKGSGDDDRGHKCQCQHNTNKSMTKMRVAHLATRQLIKHARRRLCLHHVVVGGAAFEIPICQS